MQAVVSATSSSSSSSSSRIYRDGEEYPEEEVYTEPDKKVKIPKGEADAAISEEAVNEIELALAQEEVMSMNVSGCLLDEEESNKR